MGSMRGILNRLFWVCWALWTGLLLWTSQRDQLAHDPLAFLILAPIALRLIVWFILRGLPLSR